MVETADGEQVRVTKIHPVKNGDGYKSIGTLKVGDSLTVFKDGK